MSYQLNSKIRSLIPYEPICGDFEIRLDANESYINFPRYITDKIQEQIKSIDFNRYPDPYCKGLCKSVAQFYNIDENLITIGDGSDELIGVIINSFLQKGDNIITLSHDFSMYGFYAFLSEMNNIVVDKNEDLTIDVDRVIKTACENDVKMIIFSNPCNPTSIGLDKQSVRKLINSVESLVVLDEAYMDFWNESLLSETADYDNLIILRTASKAFGAAAVRLGIAVANNVITQALKAVKAPYNVNSVTQKIGEIIYKEKNFITGNIKEIIKNKEFLANGLLKIQKNRPDVFTVYKSDTNFVFMKMENTNKSKEIFEYLKENKIVIRCMGSFLRVTAGSKDQCKKFLALFENKLSSMYGE